MRGLFYGAAALLLLTTATFADSILATNTRPLPIGVSGETTLQTMLDSIYGTGVVNAATDQQNTAMWQLPGTSTGTSAPVLQFEFAGNANSNVFGIWSGTDTNGPITKVAIFDGVASGNAGATLKWETGSPNTMWIYSAGGAGVNTGKFDGINRYSFGFYLQGADGTYYYTADQLNAGGSPQALAYLGPGGRWTFAFEDQPYASTDRDFNDMVVTAESITPVPDGGMTLMLLGGALFGLETLRRKFRA